MKVKGIISRYYSPSPKRWRKIATCIKILLTGIAGLISKDFETTITCCLIGCLICDFIVNLSAGSNGKKNNEIIKD